MAIVLYGEPGRKIIWRLRNGNGKIERPLLALYGHIAAQNL